MNYLAIPRYFIQSSDTWFILPDKPLGRCGHHEWSYWQNSGYLNKVSLVPEELIKYPGQMAKDL